MVQNKVGIVGKETINDKNAKDISVGVGLDMQKNNIKRYKEAEEAIKARKDNDH